MKRVAIQGMQVDSTDSKPKYKRAFDALLDNASGEVFLDIKDKRGFIRLSLDSLLEQIDKTLLTDCESNSGVERQTTAQ